MSEFSSKPCLCKLNYKIYCLTMMIKRKQLPARLVSLEEACLKQQKIWARKTAHAVKLQKDGWVDVVPKKHKWDVKPIYKATAGARIARNKWTRSLSDLFFLLLLPAVLLEVWKEAGEEKLYYSSSKVP